MKRRIGIVYFGGIGGVLLFWLGNTISHAGRAGYAATGWAGAVDSVRAALRPPQLRLSWELPDLAAGAALVLIAGLAMFLYLDDRSRRRPGEEQGSARWGKPADIAPLMARRRGRNLLLTRTERISLDRVKRAEHQRNSNVLVIGASGSGKSRNFILPNLAWGSTSYLVTDPKGELLASSGTRLAEADYEIRVLNLVNFAESDRFNPMAYLRPGHEAEDLALMVRNIISNTDNGQSSNGGENGAFFEKAETALLTALSAFVVATYPTVEHHLGTVIDLLSQMRAVEGEASPIDEMFTASRRHLDAMVDTAPDEGMNRDLLRFAISQYNTYEQAAGRTASSIIVTCSVRLAPLHIPAVRHLLTGDTLQLDQVGFRPTALFMVISDTDRQFSWLASTVFTTFFQRAVYLADRQPDRRLPHQVQCLMDEFANIGKIPDFDVLAATLRSRGISFVAVVQNINQPKAMYKAEGWATIVGNCDSVLFLGSGDPETKKWISEALGKQTIVVGNTSTTKGRQGSYSKSDQHQGRELLTADEVGRLPGNTALVLIRGLPPFKSIKLAPVPDPETVYRHRPQLVGSTR